MCCYTKLRDISSTKPGSEKYKKFRPNIRQQDNDLKQTYVREAGCVTESRFPPQSAVMERWHLKQDMKTSVN